MKVWLKIRMIVRNDRIQEHLGVASIETLVQMREHFSMQVDGPQGKGVG